MAVGAAAGGKRPADTGAVWASSHTAPATTCDTSTHLGREPGVFCWHHPLGAETHPHPAGRAGDLAMGDVTRQKLDSETDGGTSDECQDETTMEGNRADAAPEAGAGGPSRSLN